MEEFKEDITNDSDDLDDSDDLEDSVHSVHSVHSDDSDDSNNILKNFNNIGDSIKFLQNKIIFYEQKIRFIINKQEFILNILNNLQLGIVGIEEDTINIKLLTSENIKKFELYFGINIETINKIELGLSYTMLKLKLFRNKSIENLLKKILDEIKEKHFTNAKKDLKLIKEKYINSVYKLYNIYSGYITRFIE